MPKTEIETYIENAPNERQERLWNLYHLIKKIMPEAEERIRYGMPTFYWHTNVVHFALMKHHIGLYPSPSGVLYFQKLEPGFKTAKGTIQLPFTKEMPYDSIEKMLENRMDELKRKYSQ
ncbi:MULTISPECIES: DUF1801 domain-containing protein [unclassified Breznakia]|uniref:iron chaperone n=1 Tax=unclassified Breznakia TaxID=2623764 RepID=UPI0024768992|nr:MULTISPECIES: DUF1801 domain-containing protein [unclassified Breznakia]MDH6366379.1 uncharacterized protein YdhG (YjbR/CyaY superfamily) [Breznakia sp. PH1-1]MDH6403472.1 uncharacterized protein YdhG (YjbR/CyaY superfamily) [Breznakia sp. PF1-11]MDH6411181.1 uncharacterized protein YdhG (YjbR/CyaY superfamily) [Breznakia sp. PFB1-11]MDH6413556.1 uncharacterized protein YdhG (YjbR/CyaY superfamily) [Breznakia sp. PFB1-14]MDH6415726.1 uncharacterized protein YdhG (YjbR/CyaY superfamily) [Bre